MREAAVLASASAVLLPCVAHTTRPAGGEITSVSISVLEAALIAILACTGVAEREASVGLGLPGAAATAGSTSLSVVGLGGGLDIGGHVVGEGALVTEAAPAAGLEVAADNLTIGIGGVLDRGTGGTGGTRSRGSSGITASATLLVVATTAWLLLLASGDGILGGSGSSGLLLLAGLFTGLGIGKSLILSAMEEFAPLGILARFVLRPVVADATRLDGPLGNGNRLTSSVLVAASLAKAAATRVAEHTADLV